MAPNLKHLTVLSQSLSDLKVIRPKDSVFQPQQPSVDSDSYWEWPAEKPIDLFSASHIESNLIQQASESKTNDEEEPSKTLEFSDEYWAERDQDDDAAQVSSPQHEPKVEIDSDTYWSTSHAKTESDNYWTFGTTVATNNKDIDDGLWSWSGKQTHDHVDEKKEERLAKIRAAQEESRDQAKAYWKWAHDNGETDPYFGWSTQQNQT